MSLTKQIAKQFRAVQTGGNWTASNLQDALAGLDWQQANKKLDSFNTIVALVYHINYYVSAVCKVLEGEALNAKDKYSFDHPPVQSAEDWNKLLDQTRADAERFARLVEQLPDNKLTETFVDEKYGTYYRNLTGVIEHTHYHLGQIVILKKLLQAGH
ncbi:MAG: DinB family protein [Sphingobacteriales bacterium]|nr:DinB family protein [Sphingobacteriales bacterium]